jgi:hypothetical protein
MPDRCNAFVTRNLPQTRSLRLWKTPARANSDLIESQGPSPHCHAGRGRQPESRYPGPIQSLGTGYFADAKFRHDSEHVRTETALAPRNRVSRHRDGPISISVFV